MSEPVNIGDQTFINDPDKGWIDRKTKQPADKSLVKLLDSLKLKPVEKKLRVKIDRKVEPVSIAGQRFVWDVNSGWIDEKTKVKAPPNLQKLLDEATGRPAAVAQVTAQIADTMGTVGRVAAGKVKTAQPPQRSAAGARKVQKTGPSTLNPVIVKMINELASIDSTLKTQFENKRLLDREYSDRLDEAKIENRDGQRDIEQVGRRQDATKVGVGGALGLAAGAYLLAKYFDPLTKVIKDSTEFLYNIGKFTIDAFKSLNDWMDKLNSLGSSQSTTTKSGITPSQSDASTPESEAANTSNEEYSAPYSQPAAPASPRTSAERPSRPESISPSQPTRYTSPPVVPTKPAAPVYKGPLAALPAPPPPPAYKGPMALPSPPPPPAYRGPLAQSTPTPFDWTAPPKADAQKVQQPDQLPTSMAKNVDKFRMPSRESLKNNALPAAANPPKGDIVALAKWLIENRLGYPDEHPQFGGVHNVHKGQAHYKGEALDVNAINPDGSKQGGVVEATNSIWGPKFDSLAKILDAAGYAVIWKAGPGNHEDHLHVQLKGRSTIGDYGEDIAANSVEGAAATAMIKIGEGLKFAKDYLLETMSGKTKNIDTNVLNSMNAKKLERQSIDSFKDKVEAKTPPPPPPPPIVELPNINPESLAPKVPAGSSDVDSILDQYLSYFGMGKGNFFASH